MSKICSVMFQNLGVIGVLVIALTIILYQIAFIQSTEWVKMITILWRIVTGKVQVTILVT